MRNPYEPDATPDLGHHKISYRLFFGKLTPTEIMKKSYEFNFDLKGTYGKIDKKAPFVIEGGVIPTCFKRKIKGDGYILRLMEAEGKKRKVKIKFRKIPVRIYRVNIAEERSKEIKIQNPLFLTVKPYEIISIEINWRGEKC